MKKVNIYSDGACSGNPGKGGFGYIIEKQGSIIKGSMGYKLTTNNRMELLGVITPLTILKEVSEITVITDSQYIVNAVNKGWIWKWEQQGWRNRLNSDLWKKLIPLLKKHKITFEWVRGHDSHSQNEECDKLAVYARTNNAVLIDKKYEKTTKKNKPVDLFK